MRAGLLFLLASLFLPTGAGAEEKPRDPIDPQRAVMLAREARPAEFSRQVYEFCHEDDYSPTLPTGRAFCNAFDESSLEVCPKAKGLCTIEEPWRPELPKPVAWLAAVAIGLAIAFALLRAYRRAGISPSAPLEPSADPSASEPQDLPDLPALTILEQARRALAEGRLEEAALLTHLAALRYLDDRGLIRFHPSRTNGDYLRALRPHHDQAAMFGGIARMADHLRFGAGRAEPEKVLDHIERLSASLRQQVGAGTSLVLSVIVVSGLSLFSGCEGSQRSFYSHAPDGLAALPALLRKAELDVSVSRSAVDDLPEDVGVLVIHRPLISMQATSPIELDAALDRGLAVVVLDDGFQTEQLLPVTSSTAFAVLGLPLGVDLSVTVDDLCGFQGKSIARGLRGPDVGQLRWNGRPGVAPSSRYPMSLVPLVYQRSEEPSEAPVVAYAASRIGILDQELPGCLFVFATSQLFSNASLTREANLDFVVSFVASLASDGERVLLTSDAGRQTSTGLGPRLGEARLLPLVLHAATWLILLFVLLGASFGPLRDPARQVHKSFLEHVVALGRHYERAGAAGLRHAARSMAKLVVLRQRPEGFAGRRSNWQATAKHLAEAHGLEEEEVRAALRLGLDSVRELGAGPVGTTEPGDRRMLRVLSILLAAGGTPGSSRDQGGKRWI